MLKGITARAKCKASLSQLQMTDRQFSDKQVYVAILIMSILVIRDMLAKLTKIFGTKKGTG